VEGGSANDYDYCSGDPVNCSDLAGTRAKKKGNPSSIEETRLAQLLTNCSGPDASGADISGSGSCRRFWAAYAQGDLSEFGIGFVPKERKKYVHCPTLAAGLAKAAGAGDYARAALQVGRGEYQKAFETWMIANYFQAGSALVFGPASPWVTAAGTGVDAACTNI